MAEVGTKVYLGDIEIIATGLALGNETVAINTTSAPPLTLVTQSLLGWLDASTYPQSGSWLARQGNATASLDGSIAPSWINDYGGMFTYTTSSESDINSPSPNLISNLTSSNYTIFVAGRQRGTSTDHHGRMLSAALTNWLLGTYGGGGSGGSTIYNNAFFPWNGSGGGFVIASSSIYDTNIRIHTAKRESTTASYYLNGEYKAQLLNVTSGNGPRGLGINKNYFLNTNEQNNMDVGDVVVYNRALSDSEILEVYSVISQRYGL